MRMLDADVDLAEAHYAEHRVAALLRRCREVPHERADRGDDRRGSGRDVAVVRTPTGATDPAAADPGTIRGDLAGSMPANLIHGSDSPESAEREIALFFPDLA